MKRNYTAQDVMQILSIGRTQAFEIIKQLNNEMRALGYHTCTGRINASYFDKCYDYKEENHHASV